MANTYYLIRIHAALVLIIFYFGCISLASECRQAVRSQNLLELRIEKLSKMEEEIKEITLIISQAKYTGQLGQRIFELNLRFENIIERLDHSAAIKEAELSRLQKEIDNLRRALNEPVVVEEPPVAMNPWEAVKENPKILQAGTQYNVLTGSGRRLRVRFSANVIDSIFLSNEPIYQIATAKFIKAIEKGILGKNFPAGVSGIKPLIGAKDVLEVRIVGDQMAFRLGGYIIEDRLYIVYFTNRSDHSSRNYTLGFKNGVRTARKLNGH